MVAGAGGDFAARLKRRAALDDRHDALAGGAAVLHAAHHFLPDKAALAERHAVELIEVGLVREGVAEGIVLAALGHAERDAMGVIGLCMLGVRAVKSAPSASARNPSSGNRGSGKKAAPSSRRGCAGQPVPTLP